MPINARKTLLTIGAVMGVALLAAAGFVWSGLYDVGADTAHTRPVYALLETARDRSIDSRARQLQVPANLMDPARVRQGSGNYDAMCTGCHLAPGAEETELSKGLYPKPPNLAQEPVDAAHAFWVIKHGIKASGMPAWGKSMEDEYIWNMAAFLQELPKLDAEQYKALVVSSGGHSHGGGETGGHSDVGGMEDHHHDEGDRQEAAPAGQEESEPHKHDTAPAPGVRHVHADGTKHVHGAPDRKPSKAETPSKPAEAPATTDTDEHAEPEHRH